MAWWILFFAGLAEITWAIAMKMSAGFTKIIPTIVTIVFSILSVILLAKALHTLPVNIAYAMWTGMGILGTAILGTFLLGESLSTLQIACLLMIAGGIVGMRVLS